MSAFIVAENTIHKIITFLSRHENFVLRYDLSEISDCQKLAEKMYQLNHDAVNARYGENEKPERIYFKHIRHSDAEGLKSLNCFLYQCSEGNVPKTALFQELDNMAECYEDFSKDPMYEEAYWG